VSPYVDITVLIFAGIAAAALIYPGDVIGSRMLAWVPPLVGIGVLMLFFELQTYAYQGLAGFGLIVIAFGGLTRLASHLKESNLVVARVLVMFVITVFAALGVAFLVAVIVQIP
jgi:hypothetical protein